MDDGLDDGLNAPGAEDFGEEAHAALAEASGWVGGDVHAVGLGRTEDGSACVVAHVGATAPPLPAEVGGLPVRVVGSGPITAQAEPATDDPG